MPTARTTDPAATVEGLRVLHVVTLHTPENAFGGPTRVALNLARGLNARGGRARLVALADGFDDLPDAVEDVPARLYRRRRLAPALEVSGITSLALGADLPRLVRRADVVHVHLMRDLVTLPAAAVALAAGAPLVVQTHGMVDPSSKPLARFFDALVVRRVLRRADVLLHLTDEERDDVRATARTALPHARRLVNGVELQPRRPLPQAPRVLYLARLQDRKRPEDFVRCMPAVLAQHPGARFVLAGSDSGALARTLAVADELGVRDSLDVLGGLPHDEALAELARASVYVLPSVGETFPVSVLEAMACGVPAVVTSSNGLAPDVAEAGAGAVGDDVPTLAAAVARLLDADANDAASRAAHALVAARYSIDAVVDELAHAYADARAAHPARRATA
ncbi:glycosyltransferase [Cellulomonas sp. HD19AZ1]|uniref:glycosyltransferase n=1 Tax=Cellulomonas sp. HD19AZ1 TaxID=2559593 RepID=UPI00197CBD0F|nr:glycosyltransferase [Cellulomonas sp. HD19AZ1]